MGEAPSKEVADSTFLAKLAKADSHRARMPNRIVLSSFFQPMERDRLSVDTPALGQEACWALFNQRDYSVAHMRNLYPTLLRVSVVARAEEYTIPFSDFMDRKSFQRVAEDERCIRNHDFNEMAELLSL